MRLKINLLFIFICCWHWTFSQLKLVKSHKLPQDLTEISGLITFQDSLLLAINDGGNSAILYLISTNGEMRTKIQLPYIQNIDWEAISVDRQTVYIADVGNNQQTRKDLKIYKLAIDFIQKDASIFLDSITFLYKEQTEFPPQKSQFQFDVEAMTYFNDSLHLYTKCNSKPYTKTSYHYTIPTTSGNYTLTRHHTILLKGGNYYKNSVTDATTFGDKVYLLTYRKLIILDKYSQEIIRQYSLKKFQQFEAITTNDGFNFYIASEKSPLGAAKIYHYTLQL